MSNSLARSVEKSGNAERFYMNVALALAHPKLSKSALCALTINEFT